MPKILTAEQIRAADAYTIQHEPVSSLNLMERAAKAFVQRFVKLFSPGKKIKIFCGPGNNGGDGLAIARLLYQKKYKVDVHIVRCSAHYSKDFVTNEKRIKKIKSIPLINITAEKQVKDLRASGSVIIDAIFGYGLNRPVEGLAQRVIQQINQSGATVVAVDLPSGLFSDVISQNKHTIVQANYTLTFELPKLSFFFPGNYQFAGDWEAVPIGLHKEGMQQQASGYFYITREDVVSFIRPRKKFNHKGTFGHALLVTGSYGKIGAAILTAKASLRTGAGLVTVHLPQCGYDIMQRSIPEVMASVDKSVHYFSKLSDIEKFDAIGIGPGIDTKKQVQEGFSRLLRMLFTNEKLARKPLVIDADAINILGQNRNWIQYLPKNSILTPHPKEFERLAGKTKDDEERHQVQLQFAKQHKVYVILKGAHTAIACPDGKCYFNSTGNPGMATAGSGDVLTGILTALLAQGYPTEEACILGVYLHGLAGDAAAAKKSQPAMIASDIIECIAEAYKTLEVKTKN